MEFVARGTNINNNVLGSGAMS